MGFIDKSTRIAFPCPGCGKGIQESIGRLERNPTLTCNGCGQAINVQADELAAGIKKVEKSIADFRRKLGRLKL